MSSGRAQAQLAAAGFPAATSELAYAEPVDELAGGAAELELEVCVDGFEESAARISVGYLPGGPVTSGQQVIQRGEKRVLRRQLVKPGAVLVIATDRPARAEVRVVGAKGWDVDEADDADVVELDRGRGWDVDEADDADVVELDNACSAVDVLSYDTDQVRLDDEELEADPKVVSAIGAAAASTADKVATMNGVLARLEKLYSAALKERSMSFLLATGANVDEQLKNERRTLDFLKGEGFALVVSGQRQLTSGDPDKPGWLEVADGSGTTLQHIAGDIEKWDLSSTVAAAAPDVAKTVADVGKGSKEMLTTVAWILGLYLAIKVLT